LAATVESKAGGATAAEPKEPELMSRIFPAALAAALLGLTPAAGRAARPRPSARTRPGLVGAGTPRTAVARAYWKLPRQQGQRYNQLQFEINKLLQQRQSIDQRIAQAQREQHDLLGFPPR
jgi:uncharacterized lipoprotein YmbA